MADPTVCMLEASPSRCALGQLSPNPVINVHCHVHTHDRTLQPQEWILTARAPASVPTLGPGSWCTPLHVCLQSAYHYIGTCSWPPQLCGAYYWLQPPPLPALAPSQQTWKYCWGNNNLCIHCKSPTVLIKDHIIVNVMDSSSLS